MPETGFLVTRLNLIVRFFISEKDHLKFCILGAYVCLCVRWWLYKPILALNCRLQIEQVNSDCAESDDGPLAQFVL